MLGSPLRNLQDGSPIFERGAEPIPGPRPPREEYMKSPVSMRPALIALFSVAGCAAHQSGQGRECAKVASGTELASSVRARDLAGSFRVVMVGESADFDGTRIEGTLDLLPQDSALQSLELFAGSPVSGARMPLHGALDAAIEQVGGVRVGDATRRDPMQPGVAVLEQTRAGAGERALSITLRVGADANRRDMVRFDGGFMALYVKEITADGFRGDWSSGSRGPTHVGHFCANRVRRASISGDGLGTPPSDP